ncbi:uncharacterized protein LOC133914585 [Phragmites australis]|uniref:uncharacterized protein LOC133914585 n=1 Tax=Phragmites australis TaxID=29695 RepID=UPI002D7A1D0C|nr:uncharacterized protein LOC133914585 [Phragmites australis]
MRIEGLFHDNTETRAIYLEQEFHSLMQGTSSIVKYRRRQKALVDDLTTIGTVIADRSLILKTIHRLNSHFSHTRTLLSMQHPVPSFHKVCSALMLEKLKTKSSNTPLASVLVANHSPNSGNKNSSSAGSDSNYTHCGHSYSNANGNYGNGGNFNRNRSHNNGNRGNRNNGSSGTNSSSKAPLQSL